MPEKSRSEVPTRERIAAAAREVAAVHDCELVVLFGSAARGDGAPRDIDLGILCPAPPDLVALTNAFIRALRFQHVDLVDLRRADPLLAMLVARDGVLLHEDAPGRFAEFTSLAVRRYADTAKFRALEHAEIRAFIERSGVGP